MRPLMPLMAGAAVLAVGAAHAGSMPDRGRLLMTSGVSQVEGQAGGGLAGWSVISGYGSKDSWGGSAFGTFIALDDFTATSTGAAIGIANRIEISYARMAFDTEEAGEALGLGEGFTFDQDVFAAKARLFGDLVTDQDSLMPQVALGVQHKVNRDEAIVRAVGADAAEGTDIVLTATKLFLAQSVLLSAGVRSTEANQFGFLGFSDDRSLQAEASGAFLATRRLALGAEYRSKPDNLAFAREDDAYDLFAAFFVNKHLSLTAAYVDLGSIATFDGQRGAYLSLQGSF